MIDLLKMGKGTSIRSIDLTLPLLLQEKGLGDEVLSDKEMGCIYYLTRW